MDQLLLIDSLAVLSSYVNQAQQRQQAGLPIDETLLWETQQMIRRLSALVSTQYNPTNHDSKVIQLLTAVLLQLTD